MKTANSIKNIFKVEVPTIRDKPSIAHSVVIKDPKVFRRDWTITLAQTFDFLRVTLDATDDPYTDIGFTIWMHLLPLANGSPMKFAIPPSGMQFVQLPVTVYLNPFHVQDGERYRFYMVISCDSELSNSFWKPAIKMISLPSETFPKVANTSAKDSTLTHVKENMLTLLGDIYSVDTKLIFTQDKSYIGIELWAHRSILLKYPILDYLIKQAKRNQATATEVGPYDDSEFGPLTISIDDASIATFCAILMFIYTGKIALSIDPSQFAIRKPHTSLFIHERNGRPKDMFRWHPLDSHSPWILKNITWQELHDAAVNYRIDELRVQCEAALNFAVKED
ncbi:hypothetical protein MVEG_00116 [Podila verticillata NRRL 6337]|nr:hypothetical protein MVEG_00116 [Podila verticillata NRRL 6337]